jgi:TPR repeat protein
MLAGVGCSSVPGDAALRSGHAERAALLYQRGAEQGDASAALRLGNLINEGRVSVEEYGQAGEWFKRSCDLGSSIACHNVGVAFEYGNNGLPKDLAAAQEVYLYAANTGYMQSQYNLGSMYANNHVIPPNDTEGLKWLLLARASAEMCKHQSLCQWILEDPPGHMRELEGRLSKSEQEVARELAARWKPQQ